MRLGCTFRSPSIRALPAECRAISLDQLQGHVSSRHARRNFGCSTRCSRTRNGPALPTESRSRFLRDISFSQQPGRSSKAVRHGESAGATRIPARAYRRAIRGRGIGRGLTARFDHAASRVALAQERQRQIRHLAARLLSRIDITRARAPSAFWAHCGHATFLASAILARGADSRSRISRNTNRRARAT
jgi:hypothetical protein